LVSKFSRVILLDLTALGYTFFFFTSLVFLYYLVLSKRLELNSCSKVSFKSIVLEFLFPPLRFLTPIVLALGNPCKSSSRMLATLSSTSSLAYLIAVLRFCSRLFISFLSAAISSSVVNSKSMVFWESGLCDGYYLT
jgi:hypothetical protein